MNFLKNKHLIIAMLVAPLLAVIAYFSVDHFVSEKPHVAAKGESYKLKANSNCRYKSGICTLENGDVEIELQIKIIDQNKITILLSSVLPLQGAIISLLATNEPEKHIIMTADTDKANSWLATLNAKLDEQSLLRLVINVSDTLYYAQTSTVFVDYETIFSQDNFSMNARLNGN